MPVAEQAMLDKVLASKTLTILNQQVGIFMSSLILKVLIKNAEEFEAGNVKMQFLPIYIGKARKNFLTTHKQQDIAAIEKKHSVFIVSISEQPQVKGKKVKSKGLLLCGVGQLQTARKDLIDLITTVTKFKKTFHTASPLLASYFEQKMQGIVKVCRNRMHT